MWKKPLMVCRDLPLLRLVLSPAAPAPRLLWEQEGGLLRQEIAHAASNACLLTVFPRDAYRRSQAGGKTR